MLIKNCLAFSLLCFLLVGRGVSQKLLEGQVLEKSNQQPIAGASIYLKNEKKIAISDSRGFFSIKAQKETDTLIITQIGYKAMEIPLKFVSLPLICSLEIDEHIEPITITPKKKRPEKIKLGDLRSPRNSLFFRNSEFFITSQQPIVTFIANPKKREGRIEKIYIKLCQDKNKSENQIYTSLTQKNQVYTTKNPEYLKIRLWFLSSTKESIPYPYQNLILEPIIVEIQKFQSQWIDVSSYYIPFPENGAFVGMQVVEVKGEDNWGNVSIPMFFSKETCYDYIFVGSEWKRNNTSKGFIDKKSNWVYAKEEAWETGLKIKEKKYTYGFAIEVSY